MANNKVFIPVWARNFPALPVNNKNAKKEPLVAVKVAQAR